MLLTDKYADKIHGIITCYDRMIIQGYIPNWSHAEAMTAYMKLNGIRIFDYPTSFSQPLTEQVRQNAEKIAHENGMEIEFIRKLHAFRPHPEHHCRNRKNGRSDPYLFCYGML